MTHSTSNPAPIVQRLLASALLLIAAFCVYGNAIQNPFIIDDALAIEHHPDVLRPDGLFRLWGHDYWAGLGADPNLYRPITILSYHLNCLFTGMDPAAFRVVNIVLLALLAWLFGRWLSRYVHPIAAWAAAFVFLIHPSNTEVINHVVGRADILALIGVFMFLIGQWSLGLSRRVTTLTTTKNGRPTTASFVNSYLLAFVGAILALGSKESGWVVIPLVALASSTPSIREFAVQENTSAAHIIPRAQPKETMSNLPIVPVGTSGPTSAQGPKGSSIDVWVDAGPISRTFMILLPLALLYFIGRFHAVGLGYRLPPSALDDLTGNPLRGEHFLKRLPAALSILCDYVLGVFRPVTAFNHIPATLPTWSSTTPYAGAAILVGAGVLFARSFFSSTTRWLIIPLALAIFHFLLIGNLLAPTGVYFANRLSLPFTLCVLSLFAYVADRWLSRPAAAKSDLNPPATSAPASLFSQRLLLAAIPLAVITPVLIASTVRANAKWNSELSRMTADASMEPGNPVAMYHMGIALSNVGRNDEAADWLGDAVRRSPDSLQARMNLGGVLYLLGRYHDAREEYVRVIKESDEPSMLGKAFTAMGVMAMLEKDYASAEHHLGEAYKNTPRDVDVLFNRAELAKARGRYQMALQRYQELFEVAPRHEAGKKAYEELMAFLSQKP